jgi:phosphohistidine phosphatase
VPRLAEGTSDGAWSTTLRATHHVLLGRLDTTKCVTPMASGYVVSGEPTQTVARRRSQSGARVDAGSSSTTEPVSFWIRSFVGRGERGAGLCVPPPQPETSAPGREPRRSAQLASASCAKPASVAPRMQAPLYPGAVRLYLVRHAEAAPGKPDELRRLTPGGRDQARALGERLRAEGVAPDAVLSSPLLRARETADALGFGRSEPDERLAPGATVDDVRASIGERGEIVVVVGHQPDCGNVTLALTGEERPFAPAGFAAIDLP